jgi:membrane-associated phospholipid phosphatase
MQTWIVGLVVTSVAVLMSFVWLDRPVAFLVDSLVGRPHFLKSLGETPALFAPAAVLALLALAVRRLAGRPVDRPDIVLVLVCVSGGIGQALKTPLKLLFGRTWPATLVRHDIYGFYPFHTGPAFAAFPSGHMAAVAAVLSILWVWYPTFRPAYLAMAMACAAGLVAANYHFVGDVIAGAFLGVTTAMLADHGWDLWRRRHQSSAWARLRRPSDRGDAPTVPSSGERREISGDIADGGASGHIL